MPALGDVKLPTLKWSPVERAELVVAEAGPKLKHRAQNISCYRPLDDSILMPMREQFPTARDGELMEFSARSTKLSQTCVCGAVHKKPLSQSRHECPVCGAAAQRDLFPAFLARFVVSERDEVYVDVHRAREAWQGAELLLSRATSALQGRFSVGGYNYIINFEKTRPCGPAPPPYVRTEDVDDERRLSSPHRQMGKTGIRANDGGRCLEGMDGSVGPKESLGRNGHIRREGFGDGQKTIDQYRRILRASANTASGWSEILRRTTTTLRYSSNSRNPFL